MTKLSENMTQVLAQVADQGSAKVWGRDQATAKALEARGLVKITAEGFSDYITGDGNRKGVHVEITDAGFELALELL